MNLIIAFVAGALTWHWIARLAWRYAMRMHDSGGTDVRTRFVQRMPPDEFEALRESIEQEARRRSLT